MTTERRDPLVTESGCLRLVLGPCIALAIATLPFVIDSWTAARIASVALIEMLGACLLLSLIAPRAFHWAGRIAARLVTLVLTLHFVSDAIDDPASLWNLRGLVNRSEASALNALLGLLVVGLPCARYARLGRWRAPRGANAPVERSGPPHF